MPNSFIQKSAFSFTDTTLPKLWLDPLLLIGSLFRYDFLSSYSNPNADGALTTGATFLNLAEDSNLLTYSAGNNPYTVKTGKKGLASVFTTSNVMSSLTLPSGSYDLHTPYGGDSFVFNLWVNVASIGATSTWFGDNSITSPYWGANSTQYVLESVSSTGLYAYIRNGLGFYLTSSSYVLGALIGTAILISVAYYQGTLFLYINNTLISSVAYAQSATLGLPSKKSHGTYIFGGIPANGDTVIINGVTVTWVTSGATGAQVNIGADATTSATNLVNYINANTTNLGATSEQNGTTILVLNVSTSALLTLVKTSANITIGTPVAAKTTSMFPVGTMDTYCMSLEDLTISGRTAVAAIAAEYAGYRPRLVAAGLAT